MLSVAGNISHHASVENLHVAVHYFIKNFIRVCLDSAAYASGASTVAIDNKIEQAMDLVKSHLMFAVREEVDVLKEKITELMERISQLEIENTLLRAGASPETLAKLSSPALPQASTTTKTQQPQQQPPTATS